MKNIVTIILAFLALSCKSQTVSLEAAAQCQENPNCTGYTYAKDTNNTLNKYVGTWKGVYNGKIYEMKFNKYLYDNTDIKRDMLKGRLRLTIPGNLTLTIFDNFTEPDDNKTRFSGLGLTSDLQGYRMIFSGPFTGGCMNRGTVAIRINTNNPDQMRVIYQSAQDIVVGECPSSFLQTLPELQEIILTKQ